MQMEMTARWIPPLDRCWTISNNLCKSSFTQLQRSCFFGCNAEILPVSISIWVECQDATIVQGELRIVICLALSPWADPTFGFGSGAWNAMMSTLVYCRTMRYFLRSFQQWCRLEEDGILVEFNRREDRCHSGLKGSKLCHVTEFWKVSHSLNNLRDFKNLGGLS